MKILPSLATLLYLLFIGCATSGPQTAKMQQKLLQKWSKAADLTDFLAKYPHTGILAIEYCETHDCKELMSSADLNIPVYGREDAFMRGINTLIKIHEVELQKATPYISYELMSGSNKDNERKTITLDGL